MPPPPTVTPHPHTPSPLISAMTAPTISNLTYTAQPQNQPLHPLSLTPSSTHSPTPHSPTPHSPTPHSPTSSQYSHLQWLVYHTVPLDSDCSAIPPHSSPGGDSWRWHHSGCSCKLKEPRYIERSLYPYEDNCRV